MNKGALCDALTSKLELKRPLVWISVSFCFSSPYLAPINIPQYHPPQILQYNAPPPSLISPYIQHKAATKAGKKMIFGNEVVVKAKLAKNSAKTLY